MFGYAYPRINDGSLWKEKIADDMRDKGYEMVDDTENTSYKFEKDAEVHG